MSNFFEKIKLDDNKIKIKTKLNKLACFLPENTWDQF